MAKILVVDDQFGVRSLLVELFRGDHHEVKTAENGEEALRLFRAFEPDLILMDMKMPGMNGIEALEKIRTIDRQVAVIMMTAYGETNQNKEQTKALGVLYYMDKPFDLFELREHVKAILNSSGIIARRTYKLIEIRTIAKLF